MRDPNRIDKFLTKFGEYWKQVPDWRFGQVVENVMRNTSSTTQTFFIEDEDFIKNMKSFFEEGL